MPRTKYGTLSIKLIGSFFFFMLVFWAFILAGYRGGDTFFSNPPLAIPISLAGLSGISAFFTGIFAIIRHRERSILVFLSVFIGLFVLYFVSGEILFPH